MGGFDFSVITNNWEYLAKGLRYTVQVNGRPVAVASAALSGDSTVLLLLPRGAVQKGDAVSSIAHVVGKEEVEE